jgi:MoaA/NifB/PqqE/SkfB family radical SAM enzyme
MEASGWSDYCQQIRQSGRDYLDFEDRTPEEREQSSRALDLSNEIEDKYNKEDEEMLIRLIRIRHALWT